MMRPVLVALCVCFAVAAPSFAGEVRATQEPVAGSYIVVFKAGAVRAEADAPRSGRSSGLRPGSSREHTVATSASSTSTRSRASRSRWPRIGPEALAANPRVAYVEPDQVVHAFPAQTPARGALDRIDQRDLPLNNTYNYNQTDGRSRVRHRHRHPLDPPGIHRQDGQRRRFRR